MSVKPCDKCNIIMVNYTDLWLVHSRIASLLDGVRLELMEFKARSTLLGACISCSLLKSDLEAAAIEIKDLKDKLDHPSRYTILSPSCETCVSLKGKLFYAAHGVSTEAYAWKTCTSVRWVMIVSLTTS
jgi:hypothetical protein